MQPISKVPAHYLGMRDAERGCAPDFEYLVKLNWSVVQWSVFSKRICEILSWGSGLCVNKDLVLYVKIIKVNVVCARTMQPFNLESLFC